ncbi:Rapid ALkalinization Factor [Artemisia annua]|uniref:Rapid ALkalinization Factor n=1 Tax=Artemisia annua TaxID=35608 RepID=A0A2U1QLN9_ARTAN|nr:Rapid ALkalinization Factor [Artemisia annua]
MSKPRNLLLILATLLLTHMISTTASSENWISDTTNWIPTTTTATTIGDLEEIEFEMDSESSRRILATNRRYISYGALSKNNVPCSRRGASYYNCRSGGQANPYSRGCSRISRCRR